ncbi:MAG: glycosyltransferase [Promethearchaeota archaeon]
MKIGIFSEVTIYNPPFPSGVSRFFREITTQLVKRGHEIVIFEPKTYIKQPKIEKIKNKITTYRPFSVRWTNYSNYPICFPLKEIFLGIPFDLDIVHANHIGMGIFAATTSWKRQIPRIISYHTPLIHYLNYIPLPLFFFRSKKLVNFFIRLSYHRFGLTIVPTQGVKNELIRRGFKGPFGFFPTCLDLQNLPKPSTKDLDVFRQKYNLNGKKIVLFVGRMSPEKGVNQILYLIPAILKKEPNTHFLMVGTGPFLEYYKELTEKKDLNGNVTFTGYVSDFDLFTAISIANLGLIFVNKAQIFDMTILEYWNYGLPLVIRRAMGIEEIVIDNETGLLFNNLKEAKNKILALLQNKNLSDRISENCKRTVEQKYDIKKCIIILERLYRRCAEDYYNSS